MIRAFSTIGSSGIGDPSALSAAIGEVLVATATGLFVAIPAFAFYYVFSNRITVVTVFAEDVISSLFRGMPYEEFAGLEIGDEPVYAASPRNGAVRSTPQVVSVPEPEAAAEEVEQAEEEPPPPAPQPKVVAKPKPKRVAVPQVQCPNCQQPVAIGTEECPNCQTELNWG
jgi:outer membrane biosynthesis protein TonB